MNIFFLDEDPVKAAQAQCDKHVVKMVLESAQIMCSVIGKIVCDFENVEQPPYRITHKNHPCVLWAEKSPPNFDWLYLHARALAAEYTYRYGKVHKSETAIDWCGNNRVTKLLSDFTKPALAMPDAYKDDNPVVAYRRYYNEHKRYVMNMKWTRREPPEWWTNYDVNSKTKSN